MIASHSRSYGREEEVLDPHHYLPVLLKKPGAFPRATPILRWSLPPVWPNRVDHFDRLMRG